MTRSRPSAARAKRWRCGLGMGSTAGRDPSRLAGEGPRAKRGRMRSETAPFGLRAPSLIATELRFWGAPNGRETGVPRSHLALLDLPFICRLRRHLLPQGEKGARPRYFAGLSVARSRNRRQTTSPVWCEWSCRRLAKSGASRQASAAMKPSCSRTDSAQRASERLAR
jgi:hypothetical protein